MLNAAKNTANKNSKKKKKDATSTIQGCEPRDCTIKGIQSSPKHNPKTVATTNVTVSGQPPAVNRQRLPHHRLQPCAVRALMVNRLYNRLQPCAHRALVVNRPHNRLRSLVVNRPRNRLQPCALRALVLNRLQDPRLRRLELPFRQVLKVHI